MKFCLVFLFLVTAYSSYGGEYLVHLRIQRGGILGNTSGLLTSKKMIGNGRYLVIGHDLDECVIPLDALTVVDLTSVGVMLSDKSLKTIKCRIGESGEVTDLIFNGPGFVNLLTMKIHQENNNDYGAYTYD